MTPTDPLADMVVARDGAIELLRAQAKKQAAEIERLRARVTELEALVTVGHGTMGTLAPDEPATITHDIPPSAPPHDE